MKYKLIGIDLDGTLLNKTKKIFKENFPALKDYLTHGGIVVLQTGRSIVSARKFLQQIEDYSNKRVQYIVAFNGSYIFNNITKTVYEDFIEEKIAKEILTFAKKRNLAAWFYTKKATERGAVLVKGYRLNIISKIFKNLNINRIHKKDCLASYKINLISGNTKKIRRVLAELQKKYEGILSFSLSSTRLIEINNYQIDKGSALKKIANELKINKENIISIGDSNNDIPAFNESGLSIALNPHNKNLKNHCTRVLDKKRGGVANVIYEYALNDKILNEKILFIATDLDGTLLTNKERNIVPEAINAIKDAVEKHNVNFCVATGRNLDDVFLIYKTLNLNYLNHCYTITNNGSCIYDFGNKKAILVKSIPADIAAATLKYFTYLFKSKKYGNIGAYAHTIDFEPDQPTFKCGYYGVNTSYINMHFNKISPNFVKNHWAEKKLVEINENDQVNNVSKIVVYCESPEMRCEVLKDLENINFGVEITTSLEKNIELNPLGVSKGSALLNLLGRLNIMNNQSMPIGDAGNDKSMLMLSSQSVCPASSSDDVKNISGHVLDEEPSYLVAEAINKYILN